MFTDYLTMHIFQFFFIIYFTVLNVCTVHPLNVFEHFIISTVTP